MGQLDGRGALVTGGSAGIGRAVALALAAEGARVLVAARREVECQRVVEEIAAAGGEAAAWRADVTREADVEAMVAAAQHRWGRLDVAVNNAGVLGERGPLEGLSEAGWREAYEGNATSVFLCLKHQLPGMRAAGRGSIVNVASVLGTVGAAGAASYVAAKHAVVGLTRTAALEVAVDGVRVNAVAPAVVATAMFDRGRGSTPEGARAAAALHPVGRVGQPEEVASLIVYLATDPASFLTGAVLPVDGGWSAQ